MKSKRNFDSWPIQIDDLCKKFIKHPLFQHRVSISAADACGSIEVGWYRGRQKGVGEVYDFLKKNHPRIAKSVQKKFSIGPRRE